MGARTVAFVGGGTLALLVGLSLMGLGLYVSLVSTCGTDYVVSVQPADEVADRPEPAVRYGNLADRQQRAFDAGRTGSDRSFGRREPLARLDGTVVVHEGDRYVAAVRTAACPKPETWLYYAGGVLSVVGVFAVLFGVVPYVYD
ncbi:hypothetical protein [Halosimplex salinum]|uniref:hypothetical protein n=1 Tax=Halosimplex salinum TaxID=1710538 RepID=UPI000F49034D|nr:hypothetical protein [Halosimplex salinum]